LIVQLPASVARTKEARGVTRQVRIHGHQHLAVTLELDADRFGLFHD